ncbi:hypothetical protein KJ912_03100, partial [Patescibacteria group bacterium]|nr:hypothetical protein [Patescibacteria group bacterium]
MPQIISQKPNQISLKAWAKINLTLEVLKKRKDSFHEIRSIITPIPLFDLIKVKLVFPKKNTTTAPPEPKIIITTNNKLLAREKKNNCYKAAQFITSRLPKNKIPASIKIHLEKNIPLAGGLGGSSADTAAVIIAFDKLFSLKLSKQEQLKILARFSSEAASLLPGVIITRGRGETAREITQKPLKLPLVLI